MANHEKVIQLVEMANAALEKSAAVEKAMEEQQQKIAALVPAVTKALVDGQRIGSTDSDAVSRALQNPVQALNLLAKVAKHRNADEVARLGKLVDTTKTAMDNQPGRRVAEESPASQRLMERILGNRT